MADKKSDKGNYGADQIQILEGLEPVRKRPGMYIGTTGPDGLNHLITEIFDNSRDEAMAGHADNIEITFLADNIIRVADNGRGIPIDVHKVTKVSALETIMTTLHAGGKFGGDESGYKVSGGLHGVGASVVNALSVYTRAEVHKDGSRYVQEYNIGKPKASVKKVGSTNSRGTIITFQPDPTIFETVIFDYKRTVNHMRQQSYLVHRLRTSVIDARHLSLKDIPEGTHYVADIDIEASSKSFYFEGGLRSLVAYQNKSQTPIHKNIFHIQQDVGDVNVEVALQYVDDISARINAFANTISTPEGGTHVTGFKTALTRSLNNYLKKQKTSKDTESFTGEDVLEGLTVIISVKMPEIQFEGQTKAKLGSVEARGAVEMLSLENRLNIFP
jgi:DNA gyrase subunit B